MNTALPIIAFALAIVSYVLGRKDAMGARPTLWGLLGLTVFIILGAKYGSTNLKEHWALAGGMIAGGVVVITADWLGVAAAAIGFGTAGAALMPLFGLTSGTAQLGLAVGAMAATLFTGRGKIAAFAAIAGTLAATMDALGSYNTDVPAAAHFGSLLGTIAAGAGAVMLALRFRSWLWPTGAVIMAGGAYLAAHRLVPIVGIGLPALLGILTGLVVIYLLPDDEPDPFRMAVATVLWLGLATLAYGPARGFGMNGALLCGISIPIALGRSRAVMSSAPLAVLVLVRLFNQIQGHESAAFDISQHYVLIGFAVGAILPACYEEWRSRGPRLPALAGLLWGILLVGIPVAVTLLVESKGLVGFMIGLGFGGFLLARRAVVTAQPLALATGVGAAAILVYGRLSDIDTVSRAQKMHFVAYCAVAIAIVAIPLGLVVRSQSEKTSA